MDMNQDEISHVNELICKYLQINGENQEEMAAETEKIKDVCFRELDLICDATSAATSSSRVDNLEMDAYLNGDKEPQIIPRPIHYRLQNISNVQFNPSADASLNFWENASILSGISRKRAKDQKKILQQKFTTYALEIKHCDALRGEMYVFMSEIKYNLRDWISYLHALSQGDQLWIRMIECVVRFLLSWLRTAIASRMSHGDLDFVIESSDDRFYQNDLDAVKGIFENMGIPENFVGLHNDLNTFDKNRCVARVILNPPFLWDPIVEITHIQRAYKYFMRCDHGYERRLFGKSGAWSAWQKAITDADSNNIIKRYFVYATTKSIVFDQRGNLLKFGRHAIEHLKEALMEDLSEVQILCELNQLLKFSRRLAVGVHDYVNHLSSERDISNFLNAVAYPR